MVDVQKTALISDSISGEEIAPLSESYEMISVLSARLLQYHGRIYGVRGTTLASPSSDGGMQDPEAFHNAPNSR